MQNEIEKFRLEVQSEIEKLRLEMQSEFSKVKAQIIIWIAGIFIAITVAQTSILIGILS